jgi:alkylated DNA nucleotide flippase Atl1
VAALVGRGEWTTYGEIARVALGGRGARVVGGAAARGRIANAHRVLLAGGMISPGGGDGRVEECRRRLEAEGISFRNGRADPARHLTWLDLESRATLRA